VEYLLGVDWIIFQSIFDAEALLFANQPFQRYSRESKTNRAIMAEQYLLGVGNSSIIKPT
jgi:hypothetical protein